MKFTIEITKEVIDESLFCGTTNYKKNVDRNCAFAVAYNELIPHVSVGADKAWFLSNNFENVVGCAKLTLEQIIFIKQFDLLGSAPKKRYQLVGQKFEVEIPDKVIEYWHNDLVDVAHKLVNSNILKPVGNGY